MTDTPEPITLAPDVAQRLVDLLSRVDPWPLPLDLQPAGDMSQRVVIPARAAYSLLYIDVRSRPSSVVVSLMCNGGIPLGRHVFDLGDPEP